MRAESEDDFDGMARAAKLLAVAAAWSELGLWDLLANSPGPLDLANLPGNPRAVAVSAIGCTVRDGNCEVDFVEFAVALVALLAGALTAAATADVAAFAIVVGAFTVATLLTTGFVGAATVTLLVTTGGGVTTTTVGADVTALATVGVEIFFAAVVAAPVGVLAAPAEAAATTGVFAFTVGVVTWTGAETTAGVATTFGSAAA